MEKGEREEGYGNCRSSANTFVFTQNQKLQIYREKARDFISNFWYDDK